jgi:hypothetical protein
VPIGPEACTLLSMDLLHPDPRREARERIGGQHEIGVLEPAPPAVARGPWFADDPVGEVRARSADAVLPLRDGPRTWDALAAARPELAEWSAERWLGAWRRLEPSVEPATLAATRTSWHTLAEHVVAPARFRANGKIGLRYTRAGFGTPYFGENRQVRVARDLLIVTTGSTVAAEPITTVEAAGRHVGITPGAPTDVYAPTTSVPPGPLPLDGDALDLLGDWFGFGASVLEELRAAAPPADAPARVQLWPEHFDISVDTGEEAAGLRATFGASPGDDDHDEPYLYVSPWSARSGPFWSDHGYASLGLSQLAGAADQRTRALEFFAEAARELRHDA